MNEGQPMETPEGELSPALRAALQPNPGRPFNGDQQGDQPRPFLDGIMQSVVGRFRSKATYLFRGFRRPYILPIAVSDVIVESAQKPIDLFAALVRETTVKPKDIGYDIQYDSAETWYDFIIAVSTDIVEREIINTHPDIKEEDSRRSEMDYEVP